MPKTKPRKIVLERRRGRGAMPRHRKPVFDYVVRIAAEDTLDDVTWEVIRGYCEGRAESTREFIILQDALEDFVVAQDGIKVVWEDLGGWIKKL